MTQQQIATQLGLTNQQVHKFEKGLNRVSASQLLAIARIFDIAVGDLFNGYDSAARFDPAHDPQTSRMLLDVTRAFVALEPKHQEALVRLTRAMATAG
jgi:transcriptional regulator with XRE-family HTH domain